MKQVKQPISPRMIDGEVFHIFSWVDNRNLGVRKNKALAQDVAKTQRAKGYKVRVIVAKDTVAIFRRR